MKLIRKTVLIAALLALVGWLSGIMAQRQQLNENVIRLHVLAESDTDADQAVKLRVRDAVTEFLEKEMAGITDRREAEAFLTRNLNRIGEIANRVLTELGCEERAAVSLKEEAFDTREYDTFSLPAGVYRALRVVIGEGEGRNWWCVVFPQLCVPATAEGFSEAAVECGYSDSLTGALTGEYEVRFFLLDCLGRLENFFFAS